MSRHLTVEERFWAKVAKGADDECWLWQAAMRTDGYGLFGIRHGSLISAHRFSYLLAHKEIPEGLWVLHQCDVKLCEPGSPILGHETRQHG